MAQLACILLAAGEGKRFKSKLPKPLQRLCGRSLIDHVLGPLESLGAEKIVMVVGGGREQIYEAARGRPVEFCVQEQPIGTGHAVLCAEQALRGFEGTVLVTCADIPLVSQATLQRLVDAHQAQRAEATILTAIMPDPTGYGRIVRSRDGRVRAIVEHRDATDEIRQIQEINAGIYCFRSASLFDELRRVKPDNVQGEYYLPDVIGRYVAAGDIVTAVQAENADEVVGINTRRHLATAEQVARDRARHRLLEEGVTLVAPDTVYVDSTVRVGCDTTIYPGAIILGETQIGEDCEIGPYTSIENCTIGNGVRVRHGAVLSNCAVGNNAMVGPYSHVRSDSEVGDEALVGSFVEVVRSRLGNGAKQLHFGYVGDTQVGDGANIGAGAVTCNYDGVDKHETVIAEGAFIGSNSVLVAPVRVGRKAYVAAGSVITEDVSEESLGIARQRQTVKDDWSGPGKK